MKVYPTPADGLEDAIRLSGAMTRKMAIAGLPFGGGKGVLAVPEIPTGEPRRELLLRYGELIESLGGTYRTSSDMNTGEGDMDVIAERTGYVFGRSVARSAPAAGAIRRFRRRSASFTGSAPALRRCSDPMSWASESFSSRASVASARIWQSTSSRPAAQRS